MAKTPVGYKISKLIREGVPQKQAEAMALEMDRQGRLGPRGGYLSGLPEPHQFSPGLPAVAKAVYGTPSNNPFIFGYPKKYTPSSTSCPLCGIGEDDLGTPRIATILSLASLIAAYFFFIKK